MIKRRHFLTGVAALSTMSLAGCGWRLGSVRSQSTIQRNRDKLNIYTWSQYTDPELLSTFNAKTGIKPIVDVYDANESMVAKLQASGGGNYSIIYPSDYIISKMLELGLLQEIDHSRLVGMDNLFPLFQNPPYDPNNRYSIPFTWGTTGLIYNSEILKTPPEDWEYLWQNKQQLFRRMTLLNDVREVMGAVLRMLGYSYNSKQESEVKLAYEKLKELKPAIAAFDTDTWRNQILAGDLVIAMCYSTDGIKISRDNPKFKYVIPRSGSSLWTDTIVISKTSSNVDGAYAWINYNLQPEVSAQITQRQTVATPNRAAFELLPPEIQNKPTLFPDQSILNKCERISSLSGFEEVYARYWTQLTTG